MVNLSSLTGVNSLPSDSFLTLGLNLNFLIKWAQEIDPSIDLSTVGIDKSDMNSIESLALAISPTAPGSMFPSVSILLNSEKCSKFYDVIKSQIGGAAKAQMGAELNWMKKKLGNNEIEYIITPFGVGAYLSKDGNNCWLSSSEASFNNIYAINGGKQLKDTLSKEQVNRLKDNSNLFFVNLNFVDLAKVIEEISGSLAMFTGGQSPLEAKELEEIKKFGRLEASLAVKDSMIRLDSEYGKVS
jgi:hypothetical protein